MLVLFIFVIMTINNAMVNIQVNEIRSALDAAALAGGQVLLKKKKNISFAKDTALRIATMHKVNGKAIPTKTLRVVVGKINPNQCNNFKPRKSPVNAIMVNYLPPTSQHRSKIWSPFGQFNLPFFQKMPEDFSSFAIITKNKAQLIDPTLCR